MTEERLPAVRIRAEGDAAGVAAGLAALAAERGAPVLARPAYSGRAGDDAWQWPVAGADSELGPVVQLLVAHDEGGRVEVEARARGPAAGARLATYDGYVAIVRGAVGPVLRAWNRRNGCRLLLSVQPRAALEPRLPPAAAAHFDRFVACANTAVLHPLDWRRFYAFVRHAHAVRLDLDAEELARLLVRAGFDGAHAGEIAAAYTHGRGVLGAERA